MQTSKHHRATGAHQNGNDSSDYKDHIMTDEIKNAEDHGLAYYMQVLAVVKVQEEEKENLKLKLEELQAQMVQKVNELQLQLDSKLSNTISGLYKQFTQAILMLLDAPLGKRHRKLF